MAIRNTISKLFKRKAIESLPALRDGTGWQQVSGVYLPSDDPQGDYENAYGNIRPLINRFAGIQPYLIDMNEEKVWNNNVLDKVYIPNRRMSAFKFRKALALMRLTHDETYVRVHHKGTRITPDSITGFSFIENVTPQYIDGQYQFFLGSGVNLTDAEVLMFQDLNPYNLTKGYSTARAARRWTRLDDYIAEYQSGFFRNGAVPSGMFKIVAPTKQDYEDIKTRLQQMHRGAGKNNNVVYSYVPTDPTTGKPAQAQIEWVPFNTQNKDMALEQLLGQVDKKVDGAYGVPAVMRGDVDETTYASARVVERIFVEETLRPFAFEMWDDFTHEIKRVSEQPFPFAFSFELETPQVADEEQVYSLARKTDVEALQLLLQGGFSLDSAVVALELPERYKTLALAKPPADKDDDQNTATDDTEANDKTQPDEAVEVLPDGSANTTEKAFTEKALTETERQGYERQVETITRNRLNIQVSEVIVNLDQLTSKNYAKKAIPPSEEEDKELSEAWLLALLPLVYLYGRTEHARGLALLLTAGLRTNNVTPYQLTAAQQAAYREYLLRVANSFNGETAELIRRTLAEGFEQGLNKAQITANLRNLIDDNYRVRRLADSEVNRAGNRASVTSMQNIQRDTGFKIVKVWETTGADPCEFCRAMAGTEVQVDQSFLPEGEQIVGKDGGVYVNNFVSAQTADLHSHCHCIQTYKVVE